jgi:hypothetical protein
MCRRARFVPREEPGRRPARMRFLLETPTSALRVVKGGKCLRILGCIAHFLGEYAMNFQIGRPKMTSR